jgi:hypothetical protein
LRGFVAIGRTPAEDPPHFARHDDLRPFAPRFEALATNAGKARIRGEMELGLVRNVHSDESER